MLRLVTRKRFDKDFKRCLKRDLKINKLHAIVDALQWREPLAARHRNHKLSGQWSDCWECHIEPDWLLIYMLIDDDLVLMATGTHADLFD